MTDNGQPARWPRLLSMELCAAYLGVSPETLRKQPLVPGRRVAGRKPLYDRLALDRALDDCSDGADIWIALRRACE